MVWLTDSAVAVGGIGDDDEVMIDGARIFDVTTLADPTSRWRQARELTCFAGPRGRFFSDGASLFSSDESGLSRWDPADGCRTGQLPGFCPTHHHRGAGELVQLADRVLVRWSTALPHAASRLP